MNTPTVRVRGVELAVSDCYTQMPFRHGGESIDWVPQLTARVTVLVDGKHVEGFSADLMMPRWFDRDPAKTILQNVEDLAMSARDAGWAFEGSGTGTLFDVWLRARSEHMAIGDVATVLDFGVALIERAAIDAICRATEFSFLNALKWNVFGFDPGAVHEDLAGWNMSASVQSVPPKRVRVRHAIRSDDPLRTDNIDGTRASVGETKSLEEDIARYGLDCFKLVLSGDLEQDVQRLQQLADFLPAACEGDFDVALDADAQYSSFAALNELLARTPPELVARIEYVTEPRGCDEAFDPEVANTTKPVVLDRADDTLDAFPRAQALGYDGVTMRSSKGIFRNLLNRGVCLLGRVSFQTAEDLASLPAISLQQNLAMVAALGLPEVELTGHRHFNGLEHLPAGEARAASEAHPELYEQRDDGVYLRIRNGVLSLGSIRCLGYGYAFPIDFESRTFLADWTPAPERERSATSSTD